MSDGADEGERFSVCRISHHRRRFLLTWLLQQETLDGHIQEPLEPLVLLLGAEDLALVLQNGVLHGAEDLLRGSRQPVVQERVEQLQFGHLSPLTVSRTGTSFCLHPRTRKYGGAVGPRNVGDP